MRDYYFFDIPVYLYTEEKYYVDMGKGAENHLKELFVSSGGVSREQAPESYGNAEEHFRSTYGGPWNSTTLLVGFAFMQLDHILADIFGGLMQAAFSEK